ncbi:hypothetical protein PR048_002216 [Dryococelus australis]|uniref:PiggyBac transposable element-derived protein domain-containing protein n=1 Tax=Dryococelus australis TaxID=614101 RepID=A0ABQ9IJK0_9NEOP|nr:hypothetical protein PR048_002216 [Dryococelus australis]
MKILYIWLLLEADSMLLERIKLVTSAKKSLLGRKFRHINALSRDWFEIIMSNLHCCDSENLDVSDRFTKVRPLFTMLNDRFQAYAPHSEKHSVDEAMVPYFGRHGCEQFIRGKPIKYGYKLWVDATSSGYVIWMEPYQGAISVIPEQYRSLDLGPSVVLQYADILSCLGEFPHHIFFDNFFTTVPLLDELKKRRLKGTGTIRDNVNSKCPLENTACMNKKQCGSFDSKVTKDKSIIIAKWHDNSIVMYPDFKNTEENPQPHCMYAYNTGMGGVDHSDQNISLSRINLRGINCTFLLLHI